MKILKKSALSLAVAGVVYGTAITPVYAGTTTINDQTSDLTEISLTVSGSAGVDAGTLNTVNVDASGTVTTGFSKR